MTADRLTPTSLTPPPVPGVDYMDAVAEELAALYDASVLTLSGVGGTANAIAASVAPPLTGGIVAGMAFWLTPALNNTGPATVNIGATGARAVTTDSGAALGANALAAGRTCLLVATATELRLVGSSAATRIADHQVFTANGDWVKPAQCPAGALVVVELVGPGGGGGALVWNQAAGGGGGGFTRKFLRAGDLPETVAVTVPAGGAVGASGLTTSFGAFAVAHGGGAGQGNYGAGGGGGGGAFSAGAGASPGGPDAGAGGSSSYGAGPPAATAYTKGGDGLDGGGGGGPSRADEAALAPTAAQIAGGRSRDGGGGGGGRADGVLGPGGLSVNSGAGGSAGAAGQAPGGGGGAGAPGGRGEARIWTIG